MIRFNLGLVLMQQERDAEGIDEMKLFLQGNPDGKTAQRARQYIEKPARARLLFASEFSFASLQGHTFNTSNLEGKVVLLG